MTVAGRLRGSSGALLAAIMLVLLGPGRSMADDNGGETTQSNGFMKDHDPEEDENAVSRQILRYSFFGVTPVILALLGTKAWKWGSTRSFRAGTDGWFEPEHGGMDKLSHVYAIYMTTRISRYMFRYTEQDEDRARLFSVLFGAAVGLGIEIGDGFSQAYGFSSSDMVANFAGTILALLQDEIPERDEVSSVGLWWIPSSG